MKRNKLMQLVLSSSFAFGGLAGYSTVASASTLGEGVADTAMKYVGYDIRNFSSAEFVSYVFDKEGLQTPSELFDLSKEGKLILDKRALKPGDIVFFGTSRSDLIAAGIYIGGGDFVVAYKPYIRVRLMNLNSDIAKKYFLGAKRISLHVKAEKPAWEITADKVIAHGMHHLGVDYKLGADYDRDGSMLFDCSSFTEHMFEEAVGFSLYGTSRPQFLYDGNEQLTRKELRKGDLIFFMTASNREKYKEGDYRRNGHVGIVKEVHPDGSIDVLHTYKPGIGVTVQTMKADQSDSLSKAFLYGKRIIADDGTEAADVTMLKVGLVEGH